MQIRTAFTTFALRNTKLGISTPASDNLPGHRSTPTYLSISATLVIAQLPPIGNERAGPDSLHTISPHKQCKQLSLSLYGINDPNGCPTHYRKAASTLICLHTPDFQESLSLFLCHSRKATKSITDTTWHTAGDTPPSLSWPDVKPCLEKSTSLLPRPNTRTNLIPLLLFSPLRSITRIPINGMPIPQPGHLDENIGIKTLYISDQSN